MHAKALLVIPLATALVGCGPGTPPDTGPTTTVTKVMPPTFKPWRDRVLKIAKDGLTAMSQLDGAIQGKDWPQISAGCTDIDDVGRRLAETLPGPDADMDAIVRAAADEVAAAAHECSQWKPPDVTADQRSEFDAHVNAAQDKITVVSLKQ